MTRAAICEPLGGGVANFSFWVVGLVGAERIEGRGAVEVEAGRGGGSHHPHRIF